MRARILRIDDAEMKVGLSALNLEAGGGPEPAEALASADAEPSKTEAAPEAVDAEPSETEAAPEAADAAATAAEPAEPEGESGETAAAKKKRTRKKPNDTVTVG